MSDELREKAARAIAEDDCGILTDTEWENLRNIGAGDYYRAADAVLAVLPSEGWEPDPAWTTQQTDEYEYRVVRRRVDGAAPPPVVYPQAVQAMEDVIVSARSLIGRLRGALADLVRACEEPGWADRGTEALAAAHELLGDGAAPPPFKCTGSSTCPGYMGDGAAPPEPEPEVRWVTDRRYEVHAATPDVDTTRMRAVWGNDSSQHGLVRGDIYRLCDEVDRLRAALSGQQDTEPEEKV
jgi:hypothetical protein